MYSFEIEESLKANNYNISIEQYKKIVDTSSQITWSKCVPNEGKYYIYLSDIQKEFSFIVTMKG